MNAMIDRAFVRLPWGQMHLRRTSPDAAPAPDVDIPPLLMVHSAPGSSRGLLPLIGETAGARTVVAPDLPGQGDSMPLALEAPQIADYADAMAQLLDVLGIARVDFYGQHTGALVGCELALRHPARVRRLVLDGVALFPEAQRAEMLLRYAPPVSPDGHGGHLAWAWAFVRELSLHFPHYLQDPAHRLLARSVPAPAQLHEAALDLLKALPSYHLVYRAAFAHETGQRLPLLRHPTRLMVTEGDPLQRDLEDTAALLGQGPGLRVPLERRAEPVLSFLQA
jgi:pimeloyl-ACP methyl ester carboxylesterase